MIDSIRYGLYPTLLAMWFNPSLWGIHRAEVRAQISRTFFYHVWKGMAEKIDELHRQSKLSLIRRRAFGVVLEIGPGLGHTLRYLDPRLVTLYIACEPNKAMHPAIRSEARKAGFSGQQCVIFPNKANELGPLISSGHSNLIPGSVDTMISVLSFCSIFEPDQAGIEYNHWSRDQKEISQVITRLLKRKTGKLLFLELVPNTHSSFIRVWQRWWSPIRALYFGGSRLDVPSLQILSILGRWSSIKAWPSPIDLPDTPFPHQAAELVHN
ncbi:hypothetical protein PCANC_13242 [Puccinia coronata f. sp. avenae]|nr:hypothetical protein PCANC_25635 [Puccinia coronata f. sp. avenae]PLW43561.1 hypothetical protein PCANC_13242 [Puccinia coronata f. sp. avenae]